MAATPSQYTDSSQQTDSLQQTESTPAEKRALRRRLGRYRRELTPARRRTAARQVARRLRRSSALRAAASVALYWPAGAELDLRPLLPTLRRRRKAVYLPVLYPGERMVFRRWRPGEPLRNNRFGIPEPRRGRVRPAWALGLVLLPLVGFDRRGGRLGMGGGYYDRTLARLRIRSPDLVGVAYSGQEVGAVPCEPWDRPLDAVVTEREWIAARGPRSGE